VCVWVGGWERGGGGGYRDARFKGVTLQWDDVDSRLSKSQFNVHTDTDTGTKPLVEQDRKTLNDF
jgi:hypothetical protein